MLQDHGSAVLGGTSGGYLFASSQYPRRPGDRARLLSPSLAASGAGQPRCLRFWLHMFGPGVGTLRVLLQTEDGRGAEPRRLWSLSGPAGNQWYQALVTVTADVQFRVRQYAGTLLPCRGERISGRCYLDSGCM